MRRECAARLIGSVGYTLGCRPERPLMHMPAGSQRAGRAARLLCADTVEKLTRRKIHATLNQD